MSLQFTAAYTWDGGYYELAIELGPRSDERLQAALEAIWRYDGLEGCYRESNLEPSHQPRVSPTLEGPLVGIIALPNGRRIACGTGTVREEVGPDWIVFYLPMGALSTAYDVGAYPFGNRQSSRLWREPLDGWLMGLASEVFVAAPFHLALIGHEVSGATYADEVKTTGVPEERWTGYLWQEKGLLVWHPPTNYGGNFTFGA